MGIAWRFVLVRPSNALNVGAAARAMSNFGLGDLAAVSPYLEHWSHAKASAIYGSALLDRAKIVPLEEATADCHLVLGTASAHNRQMRRTHLTLPALRGWVKKRLKKGGRVAVLFGSEKNGLSNEELDHCHAILRIPTIDDAPSMNLGQAVALIAYELARTGFASEVDAPDEDLLEGRQLEGLLDLFMAAMAETGVNAHLKESARRQKCRRGLLKWNMSRQDAAWLRGLLSKLLQRS